MSATLVAPAVAARPFGAAGTTTADTAMSLTDTVIGALVALVDRKSATPGDPADCSRAVESVVVTAQPEGSDVPTRHSFADSVVVPAVVMARRAIR